MLYKHFHQTDRKEYYISDDGKVYIKNLTTLAVDTTYGKMDKHGDLYVTISKERIYIKDLMKMCFPL